MSARSKVPVPRVFPTLVLALALPFALASCGGDAESAADRESERLEQPELATGGTESAPSAAPAPVQSEAATGGTPPSASAQAPRATAAAPAPAPAEPPPSAPTSGEDSPADLVESPEPEPVSIPAGTLIPAVMEAALSTRTHEEGDIFHARIVEEILAPDGMVLIPEGARLEGKVAEARPSEGPDDEALLLLTFEALVIRGERFPMNAAVVEVELETGTQASATRSAATVATGAAAGAVVGRILGRDTRSTATGAAVGAAAGAGVALTTRDGHATIREGAPLTVRLQTPTVLVAGR